jgi:hypothetical protein
VEEVSRVNAARPSSGNLLRASFAFLALAAVTHSDGLTSESLHCDYSYWLRVARDWRSGQRLYDQVYENKLPTLFVIINLIDGVRPEVSLYACEVGLSTLAALTLYSALVRVAPLTAVSAPALWIVWAGTSPTFHNGQITEGLAAPLDLLAYALVLKSILRGSVVAALTAGICFFASVSLRVPFLMHVLAYGPLLALAWRMRGTKGTLSVVTAFVAGAMIGLVALYAHAILGGYWNDLLKMLSRNAAYASLHRVGVTRSFSLFLGNAGILAKANRVALLLPFMTASILCWRKARHGPFHWVLTISCLCWLFGAVLGVFPGGRHFLHYYHGIWAPLAILSTQWLSLAATGPHAREIAFRLMIGLLIGVAGLASVDRACRLVVWARNAPPRPGPELSEVINLLEQNTSRSERVPIYVWDDKWNELYWRAPRPAVADCVNPFLFSPHGQVAHQPERYRRWLSALIASPPRYVLIGESNLDAMGGGSKDEPDALSVEARAMLKNDYSVVMKRGPLLVLCKR